MSSILRYCALLSLALCALSSPVSQSEPWSTDDPFAPKIKGRGTCKDNLGRCFNPTGSKPTDIASRSAATAFCSTFLSIPVVTSTIGTIFPISVITVTKTLTFTATETSAVTSDVEVTEVSTVTVIVPPPIVISDVDTTELSTETGTIPPPVVTSDVETSTETGTIPPPVVTSDVETSTETGTVAPVIPKRAVASALPKCATGDAHSPAEFSSACSCISVTASTTYVTGTAPVAFNTDVATVSTSTTTVTVTTVTVTDTTTVYSTAVSVASLSPPAADCASAENPYYVPGQSYTLYCDEYYYDPGSIISSIPNVAAFSDCIDYCAITLGCVYAYWVGPNSRYGDKFYCYAFNSFDADNLHPDTDVDGFSRNS